MRLLHPPPNTWPYRLPHRWILHSIYDWCHLLMYGDELQPPTENIQVSDLLDTFHRHSDWEEWKWIKKWKGKNT